MQKDAKSSALAQSASSNGTPAVSHPHRLRKTAILRGYRSFSRVLSGGRAISVSPIRLFYRSLTSPSPGSMVGFAVGRSLRSAVKRNRARRLMREAFRRNQEAWNTGTSERPVEAVWMYIAAETDIPRLTVIEEAMRTLIKKISTRTP